MADKSALADLCDLVERVKLLSEVIERADFAPVVESANRVSRIAKETIETPVNPSLFAIDAEKNLFAGINEIKNDSYQTLFETLVKINPVIEKFFEDVLVMDNDEAIKTNRLAMLGMLKKNYGFIADFAALQI